MKQTMVILGAGSGLGISIARHYGSLGYRIALVARRREPLEALVAGLAVDGVEAAAIPGDLSRAADIPAILDAVRARFGTIDGVYYAPNGSFGFRPAATFEPAYVTEITEFLFGSLVAVVNGVLPEMRARGKGLILVGFGGSAAHGIPFMSGPGPAMAAARNYLQSLHGELASDGIRVAVLTITALIRNSASHAGIMSGEIKMVLPAGFSVPEAEPGELARLLVEAVERGDAEVFYPAPEIASGRPS